MRFLLGLLIPLVLMAQPNASALFAPQILAPIIGGASGQWGSLMQHTSGTCTASPCTTTHTSTTANSLLVMWSFAQYTGQASGPTVSAMTAMSGDSTWTRCPNAFINTGSSTTQYAQDCYYVLRAAGGATSFTSTWTYVGAAPTTTRFINELVEYSYTGTAYYDTGNAAYDSTTCTTCTGPAGILNGTNHLVLVGASTNTAVSSVSSPYNTSPFPDVPTNSTLRVGISAVKNQTAYSLPSWTKASSSATNYYSLAAFALAPPPTLTFDWLQNFASCTNGVTPDATCLKASVVTGNVPRSQSVDVSSWKSGMTASSSGPTSALPHPIKVNGTSVTGSGGLNVACTTTGTVSCGSYFHGFTFTDSASIGFTISTDCVDSGLAFECGSVGGLSGDNTFAVLKLSGLSKPDYLCFEVSGSNCAADAQNIPYVPGVDLRVNMAASVVTGVYTITVCRDSDGVVLGSWSKTGSSGSGVSLKFASVGFSGQESLVPSGSHYWWRNYVESATGQISATSCF